MSGGAEICSDRREWQFLGVKVWWGGRFYGLELLQELYVRVQMWNSSLPPQVYIEINEFVLSHLLLYRPVITLDAETRYTKRHDLR